MSPLDRAMDKGRQAALQGIKLIDCPYKVTGRSKLFWNAWVFGWQVERLNMGLKPWD